MHQLITAIKQQQKQAAQHLENWIDDEPQDGSDNEEVKVNSDQLISTSSLSM